MKFWRQAQTLAEQTPDARNRYVDCLRAVSILVVITGHWLIATAYFSEGVLQQGHLLKSQPQMQWLTWIFQVMPIFFIVGGYSNAVSLESAAKKNLGYAGWLTVRLHRLAVPVLALLLCWVLLALAMSLAGVEKSAIQYASQAALIPTWFLAIYIMIVILAPTAYSFWCRYGFKSFWVFVVVAVLTDGGFFLLDLEWLGWSNYFWVWLAVHHLGFAWRDNRFGSPAQLLLYSALGFACLCVLIFKGPYPLAMVGSPDEGLSNTLPPKITLLALAIWQFGLVLSIEKPMRRVLRGIRLWTATVLINSMIMTLYLWHITVMVAFVSILVLAGGAGLSIPPGTSEWWLWRPAWILLLYLLLVPIAFLISPLERRSRAQGAPIPSAYRQIAGAIMICLGVALLAMYGFAGGPFVRLDAAAVALVFSGAALGGVASR